MTADYIVNGVAHRVIGINAATRDWMVDDKGDLVFDASSWSQVYRVVTTRLSSVLLHPSYGTSLDATQKIDPAQFPSMQYSIEQALGLLSEAGVIDPIFIVSVERLGTWACRIWVQWRDAGGEQDLTIEVD
jgi:hypothetical protein